MTCELSVTRASTVTLTLTSSSCQLAGNNVVILQPYSQNAFFNACALGSGSTYTLKDAAGGALVVQPGNLRIRFHQGTASVGSPTPAHRPGRWMAATPTGPSTLTTAAPPASRASRIQRRSTVGYGNTAVVGRAGPRRRLASGGLEGTSRASPLDHTTAVAVPAGAVSPGG